LLAIWKSSKNIVCLEKKENLKIFIIFRVPFLFLWCKITGSFFLRSPSFNGYSYRKYHLSSLKALVVLHFGIIARWWPIHFLFLGVCVNFTLSIFMAIQKIRIFRLVIVFSLLGHVYVQKKRPCCRNSGS